MAEPNRIAAALEYLGKLRRQIANTQGVAVPDDYGQRFGAPGEPVPSLNQVGQSVRGAAQRMTSLDAPASQGMGDTALDIAAGFTPLQYPQAARDFERSRRTGDKLGMGLATLAAVPVVGGVAKAAGEARAAAKAAQIDIPSVLYHASPVKGLKELDPKKGMEVPGTTWFSDNSEVAEDYIYPREYGEILFDEPAGEVYEASLSMKNPLVVDFEGAVGDAMRLSGLAEKAKREGYDGLIIRNVDDTVGSTKVLGTSYAVFDKKQINLLKNARK
jgi:hypothetical protein